jgi:hypothetical protein
MVVSYLHESRLKRHQEIATKVAHLISLASAANPTASHLTIHETPYLTGRDTSGEYY